MTHTKSDEMIAEELQSEWEKKYLKTADGSDSDLYVAFMAGFEAGIAHQKKKTDKLVSALTSIRVEATKGDGTTTECEMAALADEALAAHHEAREEK